ncbi:NADH-quinone oxidoreductase subunit NuoE [Actinokineospora globicatena]|uniref:NADH-quinone oxidoreductase subunit NuoE n=1 Tax=Actinokineospora globicatena TaxID=103729 RepID=UPI0020A3A2F8|nr:NADH-quinone oxidoreductase subunit NuoE [Actinokineospora globicatena]MCP2301738.1 NADH-quinone oxidoreductase subunit E [Actinokineospora globicatena]GLW76604.1 NADH-quinone oxidoreductase subunit E [Actinokineospora globicatena]GLW83438.1 NADH-quinone oxidoreductase subunit E [Actinokineospora globicatena]
MSSTGSTYGGSSVGAGRTHQASVGDTDVLAVSPVEAEHLVTDIAEDLSVFDGLTVERAQAIIARYPQARSALLPMLHLVQSVEGRVSQAGIQFCALQLNLSAAEVSAVATFYTMYKRKTCGEHLVSVCTNTLCAVLGGDEIYKKLGEHLGEGGKRVGHNETAGEPGAPGSITLEHAECLAACDLGPVIQVNYEFYDNQTPEKAVELVDALRRGEKPAPTRGAPLRDFRTAELELAGFWPEDEPGYRATVDGPSAAVETLRGAKLAEDRGWTAPAMPNPPLPEVEKK